MKSSRFILWQIYCSNHKDQGLALPIAIALGLIAALIGTIMLTQSFRDQTTVATSQSANKSESLAELGVTRSLDLINQNRAIASVNICGGVWNSGQCTNAANNASWATVGNNTPTSNSRLDNLINDVKKPAKTLPINTTVTDTDIPSCTANLVNTTPITNFANQLWRNISENAPDGQFRLINYLYDSGNADNKDDGVGTLTVEGGIGQTSDSNNSIQTTGTGITRLEVKFPVELQPPWGLWLQDQLTASTGVKVDADVRDSRCGQSATDINNFRKDIQIQNKDNSRSYIITPGKAFPTVSSPVVLPNTNRQKASLSISSGMTTLTASGSPHYYKTNTTDNNSLKISGQGKLRVNAPGQTVAIILEGNLDINTINPTQPAIEVTEGTTLIIYASASSTISIEGNSLLKNHDNNTPDKFQIYLSGATGGGNTSKWIAINGSAKLDNVFIFGPLIKLTQEDATRVTGTLWLKSWEGRNSAQFIQGKAPVLSNLAVVLRPGNASAVPTLESISVNKINDLSSWRHCQADPTVNSCS